MKHDIASALARLTPYAQWSWTAPHYSGLEWLDSSQTKPTETAINDKITELDAEEPMRLMRIERNRRLAKCDWVVTQATETGTTQSDAWKTYRQSLRDLPSSASPKLNANGNLDMSSVTFPTEPS
tara:strand:- start:784 stop:1158 length:375 start_codon:yes stop_codon:yes gene_type:complete